MKKNGRIRNSVLESEGKKDASVAKKPVAKKPKLAEKILDTNRPPHPGMLPQINQSG